METEEIIKQFSSNQTNYENLGRNVVESIRILLEKKKIKFLSINYRVKELNSFLEKIQRKNYENPIAEIEDFCGIRIICYYQKDILEIEKIIKEEFQVFEFQDKEKKLDFDQFGYRSHHLIASIKSEWENTPTFRDLSSFKFELQIRTILMHAWAEIEHSLAYKNEFQTPQQFRRKLHRISAKLEEADEQFEELKLESANYQKEIQKMTSKSNSKFEEIELNIDTLQAFMDSNYPKRQQNIGITGQLLNQMINLDLTLKDLSDSWHKIKPQFKEMEIEFLNNYSTYSKWAQVGIARFSLDLTNEKFRKRLKSDGEHKKRIENLFTKYLA